MIKAGAKALGICLVQIFEIIIKVLFCYPKGILLGTSMSTLSFFYFWNDEENSAWLSNFLTLHKLGSLIFIFYHLFLL